MIYLSDYNSKVGKMLIAATDTHLCGLWFYGQKHFKRGISGKTEFGQNGITKCTKRWLDIYFSGVCPDFTPPLSVYGTDFQKDVYTALCEIPFGQTVTYGFIARKVCEKQGKEKMSARAVGAAVGKNPISVIIPCHRVLSKNGSLTGYAGGTDKKRLLLLTEVCKGV